ncbi:MAG: VWA domain-containing protein [Lentisphaeria bacterium]
MNWLPHIKTPWWGLLALFVVLGLIIAWRRRPPTLKVSTLRPFKSATGSGGTRKRSLILKLPLLIYSVGLLALVFALCRPQEGIERTIKRTEGIDIMLALDVSGSMEAYDLGQEYQTRDAVFRGIDNGDLLSRIAVAQQELVRFVEGRPHDRIGLIVFSNYPYVACPPTLDHDFLLQNLNQLDIGAFRDQTGIASPIASATSRLKGSDAERRVLVLFTDGDNNVNAAVTPLQAAKLADSKDIVTYTVGVGSRRSVVVADTPWGRRLRGGAAGFNENLLKSIAEITGGDYFTAKDAASFRQVMEEIDKLEKTTLEQPVYIDYRERFLPWLLAGLTLCLIAFVLETTVLQAVP